MVETGIDTPLRQYADILQHAAARHYAITLTFSNTRLYDAMPRRHYGTTPISSRTPLYALAPLRHYHRARQCTPLRQSLRAIYHQLYITTPHYVSTWLCHISVLFANIEFFGHIAHQLMSEYRLISSSQLKSSYQLIPAYWLISAFWIIAVYRLISASWPLSAFLVKSTYLLK